MPSNKELKATATDLAEKLGIGLDLADMTNAALGELVADLKAKVKDAQHQTQADQEQREAVQQQTAEDADEDDGPKFAVAMGKAIICRRGVGIKSDGDSLVRGDLSMEQFETFFDAGYIVEEK